jgi:hypothetical protein
MTKNQLHILELETRNDELDQARQYLNSDYYWKRKKVLNPNNRLEDDT